MEIDERRCPICNHDVLGWDYVCPGCNQMPWQTSVGKKIIKRRRLVHSIKTAGPLALLLLLCVGLVMAGNFGLFQGRSALINEAKTQQDIIERARHGLRLQELLELSGQGTDTYRIHQSALREWSKQDLTVLLELIRDTEVDRKSRILGIQVLAILMHPDQPIHDIIPNAYLESLRALEQISEDDSEDIYLVAQGAIQEITP